MHLPAGIYHNAAYTQICRLSAHNLSNIEIFVHNPELQKHWKKWTVFVQAERKSTLPMI